MRDPEAIAMVRRAAVVCQRLQTARRQRGSIDFDLPEPDIVLDLQGLPESIIRAPRYVSHQMIEELMVAANEAVARFLTDRGVGCIYRVHESPAPDRIKEFAELLRHLVVPVKLRIPPQPRDLAQVLAAVRGRVEERWINHSLLRSMAQAIYDTKNVGHYGLASKCYCHFTSPIRRYPDLVIHRLLMAALDRQAPPRQREQALATTAAHASRRERVAVEAEREIIKVYAAYFLREQVGQCFTGVISHQVKHGFYVELTDIFVEGLIPRADLPKRAAPFQIGERVRVRLAEVKVESREVRFALDLSEERTV